MANRFSIEAVFKGIDKLSAPVTRMQNRISKFVKNSKRGLKQLSAQTSKLGKAFKIALGVAGIAGGLFVMQAALASVITTGIEFEQTLVNATAKFPEGIKKGTKEFKALEDAAKRVGSTTEFTASQSAGALNFLAMAGFNAEQAVAALPGVVDLATASGLDLARATDIASDALGAFNLATKDSAQLTKNLARINDVMAKTTTSANTNMEQLFEAMKEGGPVATAAGASIETFAAAAGTLANAGIKASKAGTTLKNVFVRLAAPVGNAGKLLRKLGVDTQDSKGNLRDVFDILGDLNKSLEGLGTAEKAGIIEEIFGKIPLAGVNVLLNAGTENLKNYRKELENADGAAAAMAETMRATFRGSLNSAKSALEGVGLTIFAQVAPAMQAFVDAAIPVIRTINEFLIANQSVIPVVIEIIGNLMKVAAVFGILKIAVIALNLAMMVTPFGLVVAGLTLLIALLPVLIRNWDKVKEVMRGVWAFWKDTFIVGFEKVKEIALEVFEILKKVVKFTPAGLAFTAGKKVLDFFKKDKGEDETADGVQVVSPQERIAKSIEERSTTNDTTLTIKDESGRAELDGKGGPGVSLQLAESGSF